MAAVHVGQTQIAQLLLTTTQNDIINGLGTVVDSPETGESFFQVHTLYREHSGGDAVSIVFLLVFLFLGF